MVVAESYQKVGKVLGNLTENKGNLHFVMEKIPIQKFQKFPNFAIGNIPTTHYAHRLVDIYFKIKVTSAIPSVLSS